MAKGQVRTSTQTPIATDAGTAKCFTAGLTQTIKGSQEAYPKDIKSNRIGKGSMPKKGVWGNNFQKP